MQIRRMEGLSRIGIGVLLLCAMTLAGFCAESPATPYSPDPQALFQVSTLQALQEACYDGVLGLTDLRKRGNFGIGTFEGLDGEMVIASDEVWQVKADGTIQRVSDTVRVPFSNVSWGELPSISVRSTHAYPSRNSTLGAFANLSVLQAQVLQKIDNPNLPWLVVAEGEFLQVQTRSVPGQQKPYPRLIDVVKKQSVFRTEKVRGVLVGFWFPEYFKGINLPGFHLHFLSDDRKAGGHLLEIAATEGVLLAVYPKANFQMHLPDTGDFAKKNIAGDHSSELNAIEGK